MKIKSLFTSGKMNKDVDERLLPKGEYRDALNVRINNSAGSGVGAIENVLSNTQITSLDFGENAKTIGSVDDDGSNTIYWSVRSDEGCYVCSYNKNTNTSKIILEDTRPIAARVLDFGNSSFVDMCVVNDQENGKTFLVLTDGVTEPKYFNVNNTYIPSTFLLEDISLIKSSPLNAPEIELIETDSNENNIEDKFYSFAYRYIYQDNEISALSPFSNFAFIPSVFRYDYNSGNNKSMFNDKNKVRLTVNTGSSRVKKIEIVAKESDTNAYYILEKIDKSDKSLANNASYEFDFTNSKIFKALDINQTRRVYDNVPINAKSVELIGNRIVFGNYTEGYNMINSGVPVVPDIHTSLEVSVGTKGQPHTSVKSNMDYEVGIAYLDGKGRMTTPFTSEDNTVHIPISNSDKKNSLGVSIRSKAPDWATHYRFFVKQSRKDYDVISPVSFYKQGIYAWIKLEGEDVNKVKKGDFLFLKSDTSGLKRSQVRVKVLDVEQKERNFLEDSLEENTIQEAGSYIKISTEEISLNETSISTFDYSGYAFRSENTTNDFANNTSYVDSPTFYGSGTNDISVSGTFTGTTDYRYEVKVVSSGNTDKVKWRRINAETTLIGAWNDNSGNGYDVSSPVSLGDGISVSFSSSTGHEVDDRWTINAKSSSRADLWDGGGSVGSYGRNAIMLFRCKNSSSESIKSGAVITLEYDDSRSEDCDNIAGYVYQRFIASNDYANLEEWFWEDDVLSQMTHPEVAGEIMFRRGELIKANGEQMSINLAGSLFMAILSPANYTGGGRVRVDLDIRILELDNPIIFETDYKNASNDIFYEVPGTYSIDENGNHLGDIDQVYGTTSGFVNLDFYNCFGWYNGYESIKIADAFNEKKMLNDSKPLVPIDDYKQIKRIASLTYSNVYESTTSYNGLNEFNLSTGNYKDIDANFGPIARMVSTDGDLTVFQSNRVSRILYNKNVIVSADGTGTITQSNSVLGQDVPYQGEYGVTNSPSSVVKWGGGTFFTDEKRGNVLRLGANGIIPISSYGMIDWFNDNLSEFVSATASYDPRYNQYVVSIKDDVVEWRPDTYTCDTMEWREDTYECAQFQDVIEWREDTYECQVDEGVEPSFSFSSGTSFYISNNLPGENPKTQTTTGLLTIEGSPVTLSVTASKPFNYANTAEATLSISGGPSVSTTAASGDPSSTSSTIVLGEGTYNYTLSGELNIISPLTYGAASITINSVQ
jgi:hypothetical protein